MGGETAASDEPASERDPTSPQIELQDPGVANVEVDRRVALEIGISSLIATFTAGLLLLWTAIVSIVPGLVSGESLSAQATPYVPSAWSWLYPGVGSAVSPYAAGLIAISVGLLLMVAASLALGFRALWRLRRSAATRSEEDRLLIERATYLIAGVTGAIALFVIAIAVAFGVAASSVTPTTTPASFVSGAQFGLAVLGGVLAACFLGGAILLAIFYHTVRQVVHPGTVSMGSTAASVLMPFGAAMYFAIVPSPFAYSSPFSTTLYLVGGVNGPWVLLTLPCWLFLAAGFFLSTRDWLGLAGVSLSGSVATNLAAGTSDRRDAVTRLRRVGLRLQGRPKGSIVAVLALSVLVTLAIFAAPSVGSSYGDLAHTGCITGAVLSQETMWTPMLIINAPYGGNATGSWTQISPDGTGWSEQTTYASNGSTGGLAVLLNWTVYAAHTGMVAGPGADTSCNSQFVAVSSGPANAYATIGISHPSPFSDANLSRQFNLTFYTPNGSTGYPSVFFSAGYGGLPSSVSSLCPGAFGDRLVWVASSESVRVSVPFELNGAQEFVPETLSALTNYTYTSSTPGVYSSENSGAPASGFGSGLAFLYTPC